MFPDRYNLKNDLTPHFGTFSNFLSWNIYVFQSNLCLFAEKKQERNGRQRPKKLKRNEKSCSAHLWFGLKWFWTILFVCRIHMSWLRHLSTLVVVLSTVKVPPVEFYVIFYSFGDFFSLILVGFSSTTRIWDGICK